jgi:hypothetical protein
MAGITFNLLLIRAGQLRANGIDVFERRQEATEPTFASLLPAAHAELGAAGATHGKGTK